MYIKIRNKGQIGFSLIEVLIAMALLSIICVPFLGALDFSSKVLFLTNEKQTARSIAEMQLEQIKSQTWNINYDPMDEIAANYPGYEVDIQTSFPRSPDINIQRIEISVFHGDKSVFTIVSYKENMRS